MGATAAVIYGVKTGLDFLGQRQQANAAEAQGKYEHATYDENARIADLQAQDAISRGQAEEGKVKLDTTQRIGSTKAALASQGVDVGSGSALDVQASEAGLGALDQLTIRNNAAREAWGYNVDAINYRQQGKLAEFGGKQAAKGYRNASVSTLLSGAASEYGLYAQRQAAAAKTDLRTSPNRPGGGKT